MKSSITGRSMKLLGLAAKVGRTELAQNLKEKLGNGVDEITSGRLKTRIEQARLITEHLSQLKGAAMKAGQLLSLDASEYFPPEAVEILSQLQGSATPVDWSTLRDVIVSDLGEEKLAKFAALDTAPAASASIGQVHRGKVEGKDVAVKIQYPGVADSIDSDLSILKTLAQSLLAVTGRRVELDELFEELKGVLHQEADYEVERKHMEEYRALLSSDSRFVVPEPIDAYSSKRVLTMTWQSGLTLADWLKTSPPSNEREEIARRLLDLYCKEFFEWGFVQTDPNYGNFLIQPNPLKLVVLDFGATLRYDEEFRSSYRRLLKTMSSLDRNKIVEAFIEFGLISERESDDAKSKLADMILLSLEPFHPEKQPFRFKDDDYARRSREAQRAFTQSLKYSPPPKKILFLHRKLGGVFLFLKRLDVQIDVTPYWKQMIG